MLDSFSFWGLNPKSRRICTEFFFFLLLNIKSVMHEEDLIFCINSVNLFSAQRRAPLTRPVLRHKLLQEVQPARRRRRQTLTCSAKAVAPLKPRMQPRSHCPRTPSCPCMEPTACPNRLLQVRRKDFKQTPPSPGLIAYCLICFFYFTCVTRQSAAH